MCVCLCVCMCMCTPPFTNQSPPTAAMTSNDHNKGCENHYQQCLVEQELRAHGLRGLSFVFSGIPFWFNLHKKAKISHNENVKPSGPQPWQICEGWRYVILFILLATTQNSKCTKIPSSWLKSHCRWIKSYILSCFHRWYHRLSICAFLTKRPTTKTMPSPQVSGNTKMKTACTNNVQHLCAEVQSHTKNKVNKNKEERSDLYSWLLL